MKNIEKLISLSSPGLSDKPVPPELLAFSPELHNLLALKNGFVAFESALVVYPAIGSQGVSGVLDWNSSSGWRSLYLAVLPPEYICFAQDLFGGQFAVSEGRIAKFDPETGDLSHYAESIEAWAGNLLKNHRQDTAWPLAHDWQTANRPLRPDERLLPKQPFVLGGEFEADNLVPIESARAMSLWSNVFEAVRSVADGHAVTLSDWVS